MWGFFLENNIIFSDREFFLQNAVDFVPSQYHPRTENKEQESNDKTKNSWIEEDSYPENQTKSSEKNHRFSL